LIERAYSADQYGKLPLSFEVNHGQTDTQVKFLSQGAGYTLFLTSDEAIFTLRGSKAKDDTIRVSRQMQPSSAVPPTSAVLRMKLLHANPAARVTGTDVLPGTSNYFIGNDPANWRTGVPTYAKVKYGEIYSGIDLVYYGNQRQLEYDFVVAPGADPNEIRLKFRGRENCGWTQRETCYWARGARKCGLRSPWCIRKWRERRRRSRAAMCWRRRIRLDSGSESTITASRWSLIRCFPTQPTSEARAAVAAGGIAVDASGNAYVTGNTPSTDFPTANALQSTLGAGAVNNAFVTKLNANGSALVYSTYLGGSVSDGGNGIAVDSSGNANVTGATSSPNFPTANALQPTFGGGGDAFVTKINPSGSALIYSSYLGGSNTDYGQSIAVDTSGNAYVTGWTLSTNFPTANALQTSLGAGAEINAFVAKINSTGSALVYSTYLGGNTFDQGFGIAADSASNAYVTGATESTNSTLSSDRSPWRRMPS
jgi:beta-propeller repeat-containing protein